MGVLVLVLAVLLPFCHGYLDLQLITSSAAWSPRHQAQVVAAGNSTFGILAGSLILYGGCNDAFYNTGLNDIWISADQGYHWNPVVDNGNHTFGNGLIDSYCLDHNTDMSYIIPQDPTGTGNASVIWTSQTKIQWSPTGVQPVSLFQNRYGGNCWVDSSSQVYYILGINSTAANIGVFEGYTDVLVSQDRGSHWDPRFFNGTLSPRYNAKTGTYLKSTASINDVVYLLGGQSGSGTNWQTLVDDLWASSDAARNWKLICDSSCLPWNSAVPINASGNFQTEALYVHTNGLLIVSINGNWVDSENSPHSRSDIWMSFDGGWTWNLCLQNASYGSRQGPTLFINSTDHLYILGGFTYESNYISYNDIWVSTQSLSNIDQLADSCGTRIPSCGIGMRNWDGPCQTISKNSIAKIVVPTVLLPITACAVLVLIGYLYRRQHSRSSRPEAELQLNQIPPEMDRND